MTLIDRLARYKKRLVCNMQEVWRQSAGSRCCDIDTACYQGIIKTLDDAIAELGKVKDERFEVYKELDDAYEHYIAELGREEAYAQECPESEWKANESATEAKEKESVTLRSLLTRSHGKVRSMYKNWETAYGLIVYQKSKLTYKRFMKLRDEPLRLLDENSFGRYYELGDHEIYQEPSGRVWITDFEAGEVEP